MRSLRLAEPVRARAREPRRRDDDDRPLAVEHLELAPLGDAGLVDVAGEDELGAGFRELLEHAAAASERALARPPWRVRELMVEADDAQRAGGRRARGAPRARSRAPVRRPPDWCRQGRTELTPTTCSPSAECTGSVVSHCRSNSRHGRVNRAGGSSGMSWLPGTASTGAGRLRSNVATRSCWSRRPRCVRSPVATTRSGSNALDEGPQSALDERLLARSEVDVGDVDQARGHSRGRLYTGLVPEESTESTELFDDLYLGLRAGGAIRKQRRGEPLTMEEEAALGHWQRLSNWRKVIAVGAFALGTFGLGFTIGGIVFGRRRNA